ncbi:hypothetical protein BJX68DRAFT_265391 [Aspergillus pseudodeflectus]|uniref:C2H2-type domain-containing protein n=1 Tax=Aspergillus pseudodeflectus TaxID=176178 RepID=A0ABR4KPK4_9EURO
MFFKCETCTDGFYTQWARDNHMNDEEHWPRCDTCDETFQTLSACEQHMHDLGHWPICEICKRLFGTWSACEEHINDLGHWPPTVLCETCDEKFHTQPLAEQHMRTLGHYGNYCRSCDRFFDNENNLRKDPSGLEQGLAPFPKRQHHHDWLNTSSRDRIQH